jgi:hypothetical protein
MTLLARFVLTTLCSVAALGCSGLPSISPSDSGGSIASGGSDPNGNGSNGGTSSGGSGVRATGGSAVTPTGGADAGVLATGGASTGGGDVLIPNWSVRKRLRSSGGTDFVLEEVLQSFFVAAPAPTRIRILDANMDTDRVWSAPAESYISDFAQHPSGEFSAVLVGSDRTFSIARLASDLTPLEVEVIHDPAIVDDPHAADFGDNDLMSNGFAADSARVGAVGETAVAVAFSSMYSVIAYRLNFVAGSWSTPARTLVEPPSLLTPFLPTGGSFDTFGAIAAWFRCPLDVDEDGNVYVVVWAGQHRIRDHVAVFNDGLTPVPDPGFPVGDSDLLLTKLGADGTRAWSRVVGSEFEDEPYSIRARAGLVSTVGRARRFSGFDNTAWDALLSVSTSSGDLVGTRRLPQNASSILLAVDGLPTGGWLLGGSDGWSENPDGLSILSFGTKLLLTLDTFDAAPQRHDLAPGPRHNEIRTVLADTQRLWFGGHEDGPIMHTGDGDFTQIHATGVLGSVAR